MESEMSLVGASNQRAHSNLVNLFIVAEVFSFFETLVKRE
jgi:hypothetical protein